jgi:hypothetical protein
MVFFFFHDLKIAAIGFYPGSLASAQSLGDKSLRVFGGFNSTI